MRGRNLIAFAALVGALWLVAPAWASELIDRDGVNVQLRADAQGRALITYTKHGERKFVRVWGAINALRPTAGTKQVSFQLQYGPNAAIGFKGTCGAYDGPSLQYVVAACKAPDGSYWAVQEWAVPLPDLGFAPWLPAQKSLWMTVSHWRGPIARLEAYADWVYSGKFHSIFGRYTYDGAPIHGFGTTNTGVPTDGFGRLIFLDTYNSPYGAGWARENSFVSHKPTGVWCYGFYSFDPTKGGYVHPPGVTGTRGPGIGSKYRLTAIGPGVTPDVVATVDDPGDFSAGLADVRLAQWRLFSSFIGSDKLCRQGRALGAVNVQVDDKWFSAAPGGERTTSFGLTSPLYFNARFAQPITSVASAKVIWVHRAGYSTTRFETTAVSLSSDGRVASARFTLKGPNNRRYVGEWTATLVLNGLQVASGNVEAALAAGTYVILTQPTLSGALTVGSTLTVNPPTFNFALTTPIVWRWVKFPAAGGSGVNLGTGPTYRITAADVGWIIQADAFVTAPNGNQLWPSTFTRETVKP